MERINCSWLSGFQYCECSVWSYVYGDYIDIQKSPVLIEGNIIHEKNKKDLKPISKDRAKEKLEIGESFFWKGEIDVDISNENFNLTGRIDLIEEYKGSIIIWDYKPKPKNNFPVMRSDNYINQLCGLYICFVNNFGTNKKLFIGIRDRYTKNIIGNSVVPKQEWLDRVKYSVEQMDKIIRKEIKPIPINNSIKCKNCTFYKGCPYKLF